MRHGPAWGGAIGAGRRRPTQVQSRQARVIAMVGQFKFLNVDLEVESDADLAPLVRALAPHAIDLKNQWRGRRHCVTFELNRGPRNAEQGVLRFARALGRSRPAVRRLWRNASRRDFDVGIEAPAGPKPAILALSDTAVEMVA